MPQKYFLFPKYTNIINDSGFTQVWRLGPKLSSSFVTRITSFRDRLICLPGYHSVISFSTWSTMNPMGLKTPSWQWILMQMPGLDAWRVTGFSRIWPVWCCTDTPCCQYMMLVRLIFNPTRMLWFILCREQQRIFFLISNKFLKLWNRNSDQSMQCLINPVIGYQ